jgi:transcriptional regulator with XRE-family HTH domain
MPNKPNSYTESEILDMLKFRQGGLTQTEYAKEIGISEQFLSDLYRGTRTIDSPRVLSYLAPRGKKFQLRKQWDLVER